MALPIEATALQTYFLKKYNEGHLPLKIMASGIAVIVAAIATAIFAAYMGSASLLTVMFGVGTSLILAGFVQLVPWGNRGCKEAADVLNSPGFYEFARNNYPRALISPISIDLAYQRWVNNL